MSTLPRSSCQLEPVSSESAEEKLCEILRRHLLSFCGRAVRVGAAHSPQKGAAGAGGGGCPCSAAQD